MRFIANPILEFLEAVSKNRKFAKDHQPAVTDVKTTELRLWRLSII